VRTEKIGSLQDLKPFGLSALQTQRPGAREKFQLESHCRMVGEYLLDNFAVLD
jgi:hypothetical protein